jgi:hypothetical protein
MLDQKSSEYLLYFMKKCEFFGSRSGEKKIRIPLVWIHDIAETHRFCVGLAPGEILMPLRTPYPLLQNKQKC